MRRALSKQKLNKIKNDYKYNFQDTLNSDIKEHNRAINHLKQLRKKTSTTQAEKNAITKVEEMLKNTIYSKKVLLQDKKNNEIDDERKLNKALVEVGKFLEKKSFTDKEKLILWGKAGSNKSFYGIIDYKAIEEHFKNNVPYYLANKVLIGVKIADAFETLNSKTITATYQEFIDHAAKEFLSEEN